MVLITLVAVAVALVATVRWILVRRQLRAITDQLRRRREAGVHAPVHLQLVDGALEALVVQINAVIAQIEQAGAARCACAAGPGPPCRIARPRPHRRPHPRRGPARRAASPARAGRHCARGWR